MCTIFNIYLGLRVLGHQAKSAGITVIFSSTLKCRPTAADSLRYVSMLKHVKLDSTSLEAWWHISTRLRTLCAQRCFLPIEVKR